MTKTISISPLTRIEGHLAVHAKTEPFEQEGVSRYRVTQAECHGEMFRGFEQILQGRDPLDAQQITQRICGVCPISHGIASIRAQEMAYGITPNHNGRLLQNLILAANFLQSHILHFYHLAALDFVDVKAVLKYTGKNQALCDLKRWIEKAVARKEILPAAPFLPRYEVEYIEDLDANMELLAHYIEALNIRKVCHEMAAVFGARLPHSTALVPGGCTQTPLMECVLAYGARLKTVLAFVKNVYLSDLLLVAEQFPAYLDIGRGCGNFLVYGAFEMDGTGRKFIRPGVVVNGAHEPLDIEAITEDVGYSRYDQPSGLHPTAGQTSPSPNKRNAYSWIKAPRYREQVVEVGPLARVMVGYHDPRNTTTRRNVDAFLTRSGIPAEKLASVLGRHVARGLESLWIAQQAFRWLDEVEIDGPPARDFEIPAQGEGIGLTEAPRGALGHWLSIDNHRINHYQCVVPTTWNCSPRDDRGEPGAVEQALVGTDVDDPRQPIEVGRVVRSFDPCIACAVH